ncbi:hypothetical protein NDU88_000045 [Pleurodeles waltl]|uniref:Uncharacterized protein n=1 Tax=Pleurodeles waltl TaxID=8319 RepID=A0AAV7TG01_PLEWA|nr:hypothetical protein NDU88_000045 [Pleurodeles waltl]
MKYYPTCGLKRNKMVGEGQKQHRRLKASGVPVAILRVAHTQEGSMITSPSVDEERGHQSQKYDLRPNSTPRD